MAMCSLYFLAIYMSHPVTTLLQNPKSSLLFAVIFYFALVFIPLHFTPVVRPFSPSIEVKTLKTFNTDVTEDKRNEAEERVIMSVELEIDASPLFTVFTRTVWIGLLAEYKSHDKNMHQVMLWSTTMESRHDAYVGKSIKRSGFNHIRPSLRGMNMSVALTYSVASYFGMYARGRIDPEWKQYSSEIYLLRPLESPRRERPSVQVLTSDTAYLVNVRKDKADV
ncbi:2490_t:CDS:2 [Paraglomus occultum]|uniref:Signal peptidase complex subunit 3 n=1 Tax=Paraglomus occultum TaxID=144539 RepID=A0A9N9AET8_9GLOM|nr:2490_t:CDS:2 [Paraglomus occultum]